MLKKASPDHPISELITNRWSPYAFEDRLVPKDVLCSLFEAVRWTASSYNEQPWHYVVASREDPGEFEKLLSCLVPGNQAWAKNAPLLTLSVTRLSFARNNKPNQAAIHDMGLAAGNLSLEATARGLYVHQMIGILPERVHEIYQVPDGYQAVTGMAIGYLGDPDQLPGNLRDRDLSPRTRKPLQEFVFGERWGEQAGCVG